MYYVYILKSLINGRLYTGSTQNIETRLKEHNLGKSKATRHTRPFELIYSESFDTRSKAYNREMYFKTGKGREELIRLLELN